MDRRDFVRLGLAGGAGAALSLEIPTIAMGSVPRHVVVVLGAPTERLRGYRHSELLTGRPETAQRPCHPTWNEHARKMTGAGASELWMVQSVSFTRDWVWDVKNYSQHPAFGAPYGATNLTVNKLTAPGVAFQRGLGHTTRERRDIEAWIGDEGRALVSAPHEEDDPLREGDRRALLCAEALLRAFKPRCITVQLLAINEGRDRDKVEGWVEKLTASIRGDAYLAESTALVRGWTEASGSDLAPSIVRAMTGVRGWAPTTDAG